MPFDIRVYNYAVMFEEISFPVLQFHSSLKHAHAQHAYYNRSGDYIEPTGRASREFSVQALFSNWIEPAANEKFKFGNLYPYTFMQLQNKIAANPSGVLLHPNLGNLNVVCTQMDDTLSGSALSGPEIQFTFLETIDPDNVDSGEPTGALKTAIYDLDFELQHRKPNLKLPKDTENFNFIDAIDSITGVIDNSVMRINQQLSVIDRTSMHLNRLSNSVQNAKDFRNTALQTTINKMQALLNQVKTETAKKFQKQVRVYTTTQDTTFAALRNMLGDETGLNSVGDLVKLNPALITNPIIPAHTKIRYYITTGMPTLGRV